VCVWEKVTHGEYKTPYAIKWTMTINGTTKELKDWDTYIKTDTIVMDKDEEDNYASTVTFSLVNGVTLPKGAKIRATSLHSLGVDEDGVYYNKSGRNCCVKTYDREAGVYAELEVTSSGSEIRRGQEMIVDDSNLAEAIAFSNALNQYLGVETEAKYYVRYIDKTANTTSIYYRTLEGGSPQKFNAAETLSLLPDRAYRLEFIQVVCDHSKKVVYWPTGLAGVSGTGFEDYTQGSYSGVSGVNDSEIRKFSTISYNIDAVKLTFDKSSSVNNPIELKRNEQSFIKIVSANNLNIADENGGTVLKNDFVANIIQKYDEATKSWVNVGYYDKDSGSYKNYSGNEFKQPWKFTQTDAANIRFQIDGNAESGLYRMGLGLKTSNFTQPSGTVDQIPTYNSVGNLEPYKLYDEAKDSGFVYIKITE
jgi:hypothetical protein